MSTSIYLLNGGTARVDPYDYDRLKGLPWRRNSKGYALYSFSQKGLRCDVYMHRLILQARRPYVVDHIDGDRLNNTRANLRLCSTQQNLRYRRRFANNLSGYKGVTQHHQRWLARIWLDKHRIHLGTYASLELAALAYDCAARLLFEQFALLNFPDQPTPDAVRDAVLVKLHACHLGSVHFMLRGLYRFA